MNCGMGGILSDRPNAPHAPPQSGAGAAVWGCAPLPGSPGGPQERPVCAFARPRWKRQRRASQPGVQHQSCRRWEKKRASVHSRNSKALLQARRLTGEGERELKPRFNRVGSQAVGAPPGQKGLSAGEEAAPGLGGSIKGSCVPAALKFTFVF